MCSWLSEPFSANIFSDEKKSWEYGCAVLFPRGIYFMSWMSLTDISVCHLHKCWNYKRLNESFKIQWDFSWKFVLLFPFVFIWIYICSLGDPPTQMKNCLGWEFNYSKCICCGGLRFSKKLPSCTNLWPNALLPPCKKNTNILNILSIYFPL